jgi:signal-transduction protein with cAMP-binding, CBS, and nucleotidyltransferase domain
MPLPRPSSPKVLLSDIRALLSERSPHQMIAAGLAVLMPILIVMAFVIDVKTNTAPGPQLIYIKSWSANRTDAEIIADQKKAQIEKDAAKKEHQRQVRELADQLGIE